MHLGVGREKIGKLRHAVKRMNISNLPVDSESETRVILSLSERGVLNSGNKHRKVFYIQMCLIKNVSTTAGHRYGIKRIIYAPLTQSPIRSTTYLCDIDIQSPSFHHLHLIPHIATQ